MTQTLFKNYFTLKVPNFRKRVVLRNDKKSHKQLETVYRKPFLQEMTKNKYQAMMKNHHSSSGKHELTLSQNDLCTMLLIIRLLKVTKYFYWLTKILFRDCRKSKATDIPNNLGFLIN